MSGRLRWTLWPAVLVHALAMPVPASKRCLTPEAGTALRTVVESGALSSVLGSQFQLQKLNVTGDAIELVVSDAQREQTISLTLPEAGRGTPDGQGRQLWFYLAATTGPHSPEAARALLAAAALFDQALPAAAIVNCGGDPAPAPVGQEAIAEPGSSLAVALTAALLQIAVVLAALCVGLSVIRSS